MPVIILCKVCGSKIFEGDPIVRLRGREDSVNEFLVEHGYCPRCGRKLGKPDPMEIEIRGRRRVKFEAIAW